MAGRPDKPRISQSLRRSAHTLTHDGRAPDRHRKPGGPTANPARRYAGSDEYIADAQIIVLPSTMISNDGHGHHGRTGRSWRRSRRGGGFGCATGSPSPGALDAQHPFLVGEPGQELVGDVVLTRPLAKLISSSPRAATKPWMSARNGLVIGSLNAVGAW